MQAREEWKVSDHRSILLKSVLFQLHLVSLISLAPPRKSLKQILTVQTLVPCLAVPPLGASGDPPAGFGH